MRKAVNSIWEALEMAKEIYSDTDLAFDLSEEKKETFYSDFKAEYEHIKKEYMRPDVSALDRHKVAALTICKIIEHNIISTNKKLTNGEIFLGSEMIALSVGLSYMQRALNQILHSKSIPKKINSYHMPTALACKTDYFDILARNLYFAKKDYKLNPLDIADKLFLLEYVTLEMEMIDPKLLLDVPPCEI